MSLLDILFGLLLISAGICGQKIELEIPQNSASCKKGFRANKDEYYITATIGPMSAEWIPVLKLQVLPVGATDYILLCDAVFRRDGSSCSVSSNYPCYCDQFNNSTSTAYILVKKAAQAIHSLGTVRGQLDNVNGSSIYSSTINKTLPEIYDVKDAVLTLTVNGTPADTTPVSCGLSFRANEKNTVKLCCSKAAMPCYPRLAFNGTDVAKGISPCVEYTFTANETVNVTKWYSVCSSTDYTPSGFCLIQTSSSTVPPDNTTAHGTDNTTVAPKSSSSAVTGTDNTTATPNSSSSTVTGTDNTTATPNSSSSTVTETPDKDSNLDLKLGLGLGLPIILIVGIVGIILGINFWKKQATGHDSAKGSEAPTHVDENIDLKTTGKGKKPSDGRQNKDQGNKNAGAIEHEGNQDTSR